MNCQRNSERVKFCWSVINLVAGTGTFVMASHGRVWICLCMPHIRATLDGRNPANQLRLVVLSHYSQGFCTIPNGWPDFFHQLTVEDHAPAITILIYFNYPSQGRKIFTIPMTCGHRVYILCDFSAQASWELTRQAYTATAIRSITSAKVRDSWSGWDEQNLGFCHGLDCLIVERCWISRSFTPKRKPPKTEADETMTLACKTKKIWTSGGPNSFPDELMWDLVAKSGCFENRCWTQGSCGLEIRALAPRKRSGASPRRPGAAEGALWRYTMILSYWKS